MLGSVLAVVDDLMLVSRIRSIAASRGATLVVVSSVDAAMARARSDRPDLVILDLDNPRVDAVDLLARLRAAPDLASIRTVGFVSHVNGERIAAAQQAGIGEVVARSGFAKRLEALLSA